MLKDFAQGIREGGKGCEQAIGKFAKFVDGAYTYCALGAAAKACGMQEDTMNTLQAAVIWGFLEYKYTINLEQRYKNPVDDSEYALKTIILDLNDTYSWTFDQIADWVESLESK